MDFPDFMIVGAPKSGTSSLFQWLSRNPLLVGSDPKETYFYLDEGFSDYKKFDLSYFSSDESKPSLLKFFRGVPSVDKFLFEATAQNLYCERLIEALSDRSDVPKIIICLRDPVFRIQSTYEYFTNNNSIEGAHSDFSGYVNDILLNGSNTGKTIYDNALDWSLYEKWVKKWDEAVGEGNVFLCTFEELVSSPGTVVSDIEDWLGVPHQPSSTSEFVAHNVTKHVKSQFFHRVMKGVGKFVPKSKLKSWVSSVLFSMNSKSPQRVIPSAEFASLYEVLSVGYPWLKRRGVNVSKWWTPE
ncbi:sulfotransferase family protein [Microbulbifer pacificus]|uniref:sulfotransferase family protein n=1 Tax=Microbulbifer pacificus TaxID=407164 RepID=UPI001319CE8D|nr:sulfotransferase [Microbulbifer pacificus]